VNNPMCRKQNYRFALIKRLPSLIVLDGKEISADEKMRIEQQLIMQDTKAPPMVHFSQYPTVKVPVKLNAVNFDGVFNNIRLFQDQTPTQSAGQPGSQPRPNIPGQSLYAANDMANLIQVSSLQMAQNES